MFDNMRAFEAQFTPFEDGYVIYPSRKAGGKFVTREEHARLVAEWQRVAGRGAIWKTVGVLVAVLIVWTLISEAADAPDWADQAIILGIAITMCARIIWSSLAPRRLIRGRAPVTPPRPASAARREARAILSWPLIVLALVFSGAVFLGIFNTPEWTAGVWAWLIGSGLMFVGYIWIAIRKFFDAPR